MRTKSRLAILAVLAPALVGCAGGGNGLDMGGWGGGWGRSSVWDGYGGGYDNRRYGRSRDDRVVCDSRTEVCYKRGRLDASETRDAFGKGAARDVERLRQQQGTGRVYVPRAGSVCNREEGVCYKNGKADWSDTRDFIGKNAARRLRRSQKNDD
jgi:hypothetical protein